MEGESKEKELQQKRKRRREEGWLWKAEQIHTFKAVLQSIPKGTSAKVICSKVYAALLQGALLQGNVKKTFDQVRDKYYRVVKSLVEYLGNKMPPKPHKQAAIHALMLQHWDQIAYPCKGNRRTGQQHVSVAGSLNGTEVQLQLEASKPEPAAMTSDPSVTGCSPCASAAVGAAECGGATTGSASELQQRDQMWEQRLAPILTTHSSSSLPLCSVLEPQTPAETPPQLSRAFTAEGPSSCRASPQQPGVDAPLSAQAYTAQGMAHQGAQMHGGQLGAEGVSGGRAAPAKKPGSSSTRKALKLAVRIVPKDTETTERIEAQGMLAYFELSCRGHKAMAALAAALEGHWGEAHRCSGHRILLWGTLGAVPVLCWGPLSPSEVTVGDIHRTLGQPHPLTLSYSLKAQAGAGPTGPSVAAPAAAQEDERSTSHSVQRMAECPQHSSMQSPVLTSLVGQASLADQAGSQAGVPQDAVHAQPSPDGQISHGAAPEPCEAGTKEGSARGKPGMEGSLEPQAGAADVHAKQAAAEPEAAQEEASLSRLDLFRPGATCSGFETSLSLFRQGATSGGLETSFSGLFGHKQAPQQDKPARSSAESQREHLEVPSNAGQTGRGTAQKKGSIDMADACMEDSGGERTTSRGHAQAEASGSQEPLSFAGAFSKACKRKQPSRLRKKAKGTYTAAAEVVSVQQLDEGSKQQAKRSSRGKQKGAAGDEPSQLGASGRRLGNLPGGIFSEHTLAGLADGVPSHPSTASQLPFVAAGDLPDDLPAEPLVCWPPAVQDALGHAQDSEAPARLEEFQPSQLGSLLGDGNSWDAPPGTGSAAAGAAFCTERPFAELFAREVI